MLRKLYIKIRNKYDKILIDKEGGEAFSDHIRKIYREKYGIIVGYGTYGGCFNKYKIPTGTEFGNYCSIALGVTVFRANHPIKYFTTHPLFYNPKLGYVKNDKLNRPRLKIGNDVWIGQNALILPSCNYIGNGAIIGAGSVVTKNVESYSIVAGNPAKLIKMRFNENTIQALEKSKWWTLSRNELIENLSLFENLISEN